MKKKKNDDIPSSTAQQQPPTTNTYFAMTDDESQFPSHPVQHDNDNNVPQPHPSTTYHHNQGIRNDNTTMRYHLRPSWSQPNSSMTPEKNEEKEKEEEEVVDVPKTKQRFSYDDRSTKIPFDGGSFYDYTVLHEEDNIDRSNTTNKVWDTTSPLTLSEIASLRILLQHNDIQSLTAIAATAGGGGGSGSGGGGIFTTATDSSLDSDYPEFGQSTHAWAVFADHPQKRAGFWERLVGTIIIVFQLFAYRLFATEAIGDFQQGVVPIMISHQDCLDMDEEPYDNFQCQAEFTNIMDAFVAFFMLGIFLTPDVLQAGRVLRAAPWGIPFGFACLAAIEVVCAFLAASVAVSYHLFIGEITDAVEVGVGLLFIRELSQQTYRGIRYGQTKQFRNFFLVLAVLVALGMILDPLTAKIFAGRIQ